MKRSFTAALALLLFGSAVYGAMTYDQSYYVSRKSYLGAGNGSDPLYNLWGTLENLYEGAGNFDAIRLLESTGATYWTKIQAGDQSGNVTYTLPTADGGAGTQLTTNGSGVLSWAAAGGSFTGGDVTGDIHMANGIYILSETAAGNASAIQVMDDDGAVRRNVLSWTNANTPAVVLGATQDSLSVVSTGLNVSTAGAVTGVTTLGASGLITGGGWSGTGNFAQGDGTGTFSIASNGIDISSAGAVSNVTTLSLSDDISLANGKSVKSSTTATDTMVLEVYHNDKGGGADYEAGITLTAGNAPAVSIGGNVTTVAIDSTDWDISATGAMTGIGAITADGIFTLNNASAVLYSNEAIVVSHATDGANDDLTLSLTGATDSSIIVQSTGTGADAIKINASAGGLDIDSAVAMTLDAAGDPMTLTVAADGAADDLTLAVTGAQDSSIILSSAGTGADAIKLNATAGGVDIDSAVATTIDAAGDPMTLTVAADGDADDLSLVVTGATDSSILLTSAGTGADAISLTSSAGGVNIDAAATKILDIDAGTIQIDTKTAGAGAVAITANQGAADTITVTNTQGTDAGAVTVTTSAGGVSLVAATNRKGITLTGELYVKKGGDIASPAGGELALTNGVYFDITGTNNITSIAAADSIAGRMIILQFDGILTFTDGGNLKLAGNLVTSQDDTITLICDGTNWHEIARSVN